MTVSIYPFFSGTTAEDLSLVEAGFFEQHDITIHLGDKAATIDRTNKTVTSAKGCTSHVRQTGIGDRFLSFCTACTRT